MNVVSLHQLCQQQLRTLATQRYMPAGWRLDKSRKVDSAMYQLGSLLGETLSKHPDVLMVYPEHSSMVDLCNKASAVPRIQGMVQRYVELCAALPAADQNTAFDLAQLNDAASAARRVRYALASMSETLQKELVEDARKCGLDPGDLETALASFRVSLEHKLSDIEHNQQTLMRELRT